MIEKKKMKTEETEEKEEENFVYNKLNVMETFSFIFPFCLCVFVNKLKI